MARWIALLSMVVFVLAGCDFAGDLLPAPDPSASEVASSEPAAEPSPSEPGLVPSNPAPRNGSVTGVLTGDAQLEGGCVWLETDQGRIDPIWPAGYTETAGPVALRGPDGEIIAEDGDEVTITGRTAPDVATICQVGEVWRVSGISRPDGD